MPDVARSPVPELPHVSDRYVLHLAHFDSLFVWSHAG
jgi:hypothetical protein